MPIINSSLSLKTDVTSAKVLKCNKEPKKVFQGQTHGHEGFLLTVSQAKELLKEHPDYSDVLKPFLIADEMIAIKKSQPERFVIDFTYKDINQASTYKELFKKIEKEVLPDVTQKAKDEELGITKANGRISQLNLWWKMWRRREDMLHSISLLERYISCAQVTKRPIFEFISNEINPNAALMVFAFDDDYSFGIINSNIHWIWFCEKCSTLKGDWRYTTESVWDTFPWPQKPNRKQIENIAKASKTLRDERNKVMDAGKLSLRDVYRNLEKPGKNSIRDLQQTLDKAVLEAYGFDASADLLTQLLELNYQVSEKEEKGEEVQSPGLPSWYKNKAKLVSDDCVRFIG
jgi:hypothetical protein